MSKSSRFTRGDLIDALYQEVPRRAEVLEMLSRPAKDRDASDLLRLAKRVVEKTQVGELHVHVAALLALVPAQNMTTAAARQRRERRISEKLRKATGFDFSPFSEIFNELKQKEDQK